MSTITFDTLKFVDTLKEAGISEAQAKAQAKAIGDAIESATSLSLATKSDIQELKTDINSVKYDLLKWLIALVLGQTALLVTFLPKIVGH
jgi:hypothetical protein